MEEKVVKYEDLKETKASNKLFSVLSATKEKWVAGIPGGGSGTEYSFKIKIATKQKLVFAHLWIDNYKYPLYVANNSALISDKPIEYSDGDEITLRASVLSKEKYEQSAAPIKYEGDALISYTSNGLIHCMVVENITEIPTINRP
jgi:hypothetical protein